MKTFSSFIAISLFAGSVNAADFSFTGNFTDDDQVQEFNFNVGSASDVTLRTWSYGGGMNAEGSAIEGNGFLPIVSLFNADTGRLIAYTDLTGNSSDSLIPVSLTGGNYIATVTQYDSFPTNYSLSEGFDGSFNTDFEGYDPHWALDILNVENASLGASYISPSPIPEPETYAMLLAGLGLLRWRMRRT
jgi:hypothetical protein